ncbi:protein kinase family protein [Streptomyces sp. NPDC050145]|uniref:protein kinase family protein n=1 Tax=Streptomyces sp. NPDC050145 TaxID=3365602 RepID=UPI0037AAE25B
MKSPGPNQEARTAAHGGVATELALLSDHQIRERVDAGTPLGAGIGGTSALLDVDGTPVFVKQVPLTDLERRPENVRSTANLFRLPAFCQYGIGGPGFGVWRELAVHTMTTNWVLSGEYEGFPLMYHWRVLPGPGQPLPDELADVERAVEYWGGGPEVRHRIEELARASATVALFLEYIPQNLHDWLGDRVAAGGAPAERACAMVGSELAAGTAFMNARGLLHFDAHFENILTDGRRLFFTDYGLALSSRFQLTPDEADFFDRHATYDRCYTVNHLVNWLTFALYGHGPDARRAFVRACAKGDVPADVPPGIAAALLRHAPVADVMGDFLRELRQESRETRYPAEALRRVQRLQRTGKPNV